MIYKNITIENNIRYIKKLFPLYQITKLTGGITNHVYRMDYYSKSYILRVYGKERIMENDQELKYSISLSNIKLGPKIYVIYNNARIEQFHKGYVLSKYNLDIDEFYDDIFPQISSKLRKFHLKSSELIKSKIPASKIRVNEYFNLTKDMISSYLDQDEIDKIKKFINEFQYDETTLVGCHNDLHQDNIIYKNKKKKIRLIDFDFFDLDSYYYDIANYFNELCTIKTLLGDEIHFKFDIRLYPTKYYRKLFYEKYLGNRLSKIDFDKFDRNVNKFSKLNHLIWYLWTIQNNHNVDNFRSERKRLFFINKLC